MKAIIFAGGTGKRLWPLSRKNSPKQVTPLFENKTSLQHSLELIMHIVPPENIFIATSIDLKDDILSIVPWIKPDQLILESSVKDTGPALGYSLLKLYMSNPEEPVIIRWQNSLIKNPKKYARAVKHAGSLLKSKADLDIVYITVPSKFPNARVGYIKRGKLINDYGNDIFQYEFKGFTEKPDIELAQRLHNGGHGWNAGCYLTTPARFLKLIKTYAPGLYSDLDQIKRLIEKGEDEQSIYNVYDQINRISVDYIISENLVPDQTGLIFADYDWQYISTWDNLHYALKEKKNDNVVKGNVKTLDTQNTLIFNDDNKFLVATVGLTDICVVKHGNAVLVCSLQKASKVKQLYEKMSKDRQLKKFI